MADTTIREKIDIIQTQMDSVALDAGPRYSGASNVGVPYNSNISTHSNTGVNAFVPPAARTSGSKGQSPQHSARPRLPTHDLGRKSGQVSSRSEVWIPGSPGDALQSTRASNRSHRSTASPSKPPSEKLPKKQPPPDDGGMCFCCMER